MFIRAENSCGEIWYLLFKVVLWRNSVGCSDFYLNHVAINTLAVCLCVNPLFGVDCYTAFFRITVLSESSLLKASVVRNLCSACRDWEAVELLWGRLRRRLLTVCPYGSNGTPILILNFWSQDAQPCLVLHALSIILMSAKGLLPSIHRSGLVISHCCDLC